MDLDAYLAGHPHQAGPVPTPIIVSVKGRREVRSLSSVLYGAPPPESGRRLQKRMADLIVRRVSAAGNVSRDELLAGGFTAEEIEQHYPQALRRSGVTRLGFDL
jgi:hypothetical protein